MESLHYGHRKVSLHCAPFTVKDATAPWSTFVVLPLPDSRRTGRTESVVVYLEHFPTGRLSVLAGRPRDLDGFHHVFLAEAAQATPRTILFLDGAHVLNPYDYAEASLQRGRSADFGAERILTQRAMTPFQWHKMLTRGLEVKLRAVDVGLVVAAHFDVQYNKDDLSDWEQEDCVPYALRFLRRLAKDHAVPVLVTLDLASWSRTHPPLAVALRRFGFPTRYVEATPHGWRLRDADGDVLVEPVPAYPILEDFAREESVLLEPPTRRGVRVVSRQSLVRPG